MSSAPNVLLTNDDGIDAPGIRVLSEVLSSIAAVTVIAPNGDRSGCSRSDSTDFTVEERELGFAVDGTPVDCVHFGRGALDTRFDIVVSGCNDGPNIGAHKIERSGTVCAAIEAGFLGLPGIAISLYDSMVGNRNFDRADFGAAERVARFLVQHVLAGSHAFDYLNVNVPADRSEPPLRFTEPTSHFDVRIDETDSGSYRAWDHFYDPLEPSIDEEVTDPVGTDRRAVADGEISVSPLFVDHHTPDVDTFESLAAAYPGDASTQ